MTKQTRVVMPGSGRVIDVVGDRYRFLIEGEHTGGLFALWHATVPPGGGPPPHEHEREMECFYVLKGRITFTAGKHRIEGTPGVMLEIPKGVAHSFKNKTAEPAEMLIQVAPAGLEKMFQRSGIEVTDPDAPIHPPDHDQIERLLKIAPEYGIRILV